MLHCKFFYCACAKRPYFHFWSKIWRRHHVPRPRFPVGRGNFSDSRTFNEIIKLFPVLHAKSHPLWGMEPQNWKFGMCSRFCIKVAMLMISSYKWHHGKLHNWGIHPSAYIDKQKVAKITNIYQPIAKLSKTIHKNQHKNN